MISKAVEIMARRRLTGCPAHATLIKELIRLQFSPRLFLRVAETLVLVRKATGAVKDPLKVEIIRSWESVKGSIEISSVE